MWSFFHFHSYCQSGNSEYSYNEGEAVAKCMCVSSRHKNRLSTHYLPRICMFSFILANYSSTRGFGFFLNSPPAIKFFLIHWFATTSSVTGTSSVCVLTQVRHYEICCPFLLTGPVFVLFKKNCHKLTVYVFPIGIKLTEFAFQHKSH